MKVKFISYSGRYPCLCYGELVLEIAGEVVHFPEHSLHSGGRVVWFDKDWLDHVEQGEWRVDVPEKYKKYAKEIHSVVNANVPRGCCGGCI